MMIWYIIEFKGYKVVEDYYMDVSPIKQSIDQVFSSTMYYIDFYQRDYKWKDEPVLRLLDDIFYKYDLDFEQYKNSSLESDQIAQKLGWYYLNTYVTNKVDGKTYIVDGQQRLTTLTLILIKLYDLSKLYNSELSGWVKDKILGQTGFKKNFWMNHEGHVETLKELFEGKEAVSENRGITSKNMISNYKIISKYIDSRITNKKEFEVFTCYFLEKLVLIRLEVEQVDVPMVFEIINDRGVRLKPYEILKGKLLGQINKNELDQLKLNDIWENQSKLINNFKEDELDEFFWYYLRARYTDSQSEAAKITKDNYHKEIFKENIKKNMDLLYNKKQIIEFIQKEYVYYTELYNKILEYGYQGQIVDKFENVFYNYLIGVDNQILLILSACSYNDPNEYEKIDFVARQVNRFYTLLQLQRCYDSNEFNEHILVINKEIRNKDINEIKKVFDTHLLEVINSNRTNNSVNVFNYSLFKDTGIELNKKFKRYFFARIEKFIADETNMQMKQKMYDLVLNTGSANGFHIEHILAHNKTNLNKFADEDEFEIERNRLGGLLLLKGRDNISSNNESYSNKLKSYVNTLYWNESLIDDFYANKNDLKGMMKKYNLSFKPMNDFGKDEIEERQKLLFDIANIIWKN